MKKILEAQGLVNVNSPRAVFIQAHRNGIIENLDVWLDFIKKRDLTSHTYDAGVAKEVFDSLHDFSTYLQKFIDTISRIE